MRIVGWLLALVALAGTAVAQQELPPSAQDGPMKIPAAKAQEMAPETAAPAAASVQQTAQQDTAPVPDADGFYRPGAGVAAPRLLNAETVELPKNMTPSETPRSCVFSAAVGTDGVASSVETVRAMDSAACQVGTEAARAWKFSPGTLSGKAVPVRVRVTLRFRPYEDSAIPFVQGVGGRLGDMGPPVPPKNYDTPPKLITSREAEFSEEARRAGYGGTVLLQFTVNEKGLPEDIRVIRPLEKGLSEKAVEAVRDYRFTPAMKDGKPVATKISVEISFRLGSRGRG